MNVQKPKLERELVGAKERYGKGRPMADEKDLKVGDRVWITGGEAYHQLKVGTAGRIIELGIYPYVEGQSRSGNGKTIQQYIERGHFEPVKTAEQIRREFLDLIGVEEDG